MSPDLATYAETINQAWNSHDMESVLRFYSPEYVGSDVGQPTPQRGHQGLREMLQTYWRAFPDLQFVVTARIIETSRVVIVWVAEGTHQGPIMNIPPTGHKVQVSGISVIDVENGLVVRGQYIWDMAGMLRHMGLLPELPTFGSTEAR
jgi:steroid delta-isomerase-like uncharacterized protein